MSDLQLSLVVIGAVVVGAVYLYNGLQERTFRRRMQEAFGADRDDALLDSEGEPAAVEGRREPRLAPRESPREADGRGPASGEDASPPTAGDDLLDYCAEIEADSPIADSAVAELMGKLASIGRPVHVSGLRSDHAGWEDVARGGGGRFSRLRLALQLVNRGGAISPAQLSAFCDTVRLCAAKMQARVAWPDPQEALKSARDLDTFCAEVDVAIGVNVIAPEGAAFSGARIRAAAESAGFKLEPDGVFHYRDDRRHTLFTLDNHEPAPFLPESMQGLTTRGITLLLDVPRVPQGAAVLDRMLEVAQSLATTLGGSLVDDNRAPLSEAGVERIRDQVRSIHATMEENGIAGGSPRALRLFS